MASRRIQKRNSEEEMRFRKWKRRLFQNAGWDSEALKVELEYKCALMTVPASSLDVLASKNPSGFQNYNGGSVLHCRNVAEALYTFYLDRQDENRLEWRLTRHSCRPDQMFLSRRCPFQRKKYKNINVSFGSRNAFALLEDMHFNGSAGDDYGARLVAVD